MGSFSTLLLLSLCIFSAIPHSSASAVYSEFTGFDYIGNGADWLWDTVSTCYKSTVQSPLDMLDSDRDSIAQNQYLFARYSPSTGYVRKLNTTTVVTATSDDGLGYLYFITVLSTAGTFRLDNIRFRTPAEHTINGHRFDLEVQLFHVYGFSERVNNEKVVLSLLFQKDDTAPTDPFLQAIIDTPNNTTTTAELDISAYLTMDTYSSNYFYYMGSLTYPYCSGNHNWVIFDYLFKAPSVQIEAYEQMYISAEDGLSPLGNYRNTVPRVNRFVRYNGDKTNPNTISNNFPAVTPAPEPAPDNASNTSADSTTNTADSSSSSSSTTATTNANTDNQEQQIYL